MLWNQIIPEDSTQNKSNVNSAPYKTCKIPAALTKIIVISLLIGM